MSQIKMSLLQLVPNSISQRLVAKKYEKSLPTLNNSSTFSSPLLHRLGKFEIHFFAQKFKIQL